MKAPFFSLILRVRADFCTWSCIFLLQVQRLFSQEVAACYIATADHILEGVHFLQPGGSASSWRAWARWVTRNQCELVTLFLASLADTFALQQLTQHSGY